MKLVFHDLFAGAGLFGHGFSKSGFTPTEAIELDRFAAASYAENVQDNVLVADVRQCHPKGKCDIVVAGPPCQGFSTLGSRNKSDPRNSLCLEVVRWALEAMAAVVVIENVPKFIHSQPWCLAAKRLERAGFEMDWYVLDAADFGVPQFRQRSFTIASRIGLPARPKGKVSRRVSVRQAWKGLSSRPDGQNLHVAPKPSQLALARMRQIPHGGDKRDVLRRSPDLAPPSWHRVKGEATDVWGRMLWDIPANTLRTCLQNPSKGRYIHPSQHRVISLREGARLQTVPDDWTFAGLPTHIARQIGNSVPPLLAAAVAKSIRALF